MLKLEITGDTHPKTVKLVTDDADGELGIIDNSLAGMDIAKGDDFRDWFDSASPEDFLVGVEIPGALIGEWGDVFDGLSDEGSEFETAALAIEQLREQAMDELQDA